jgi:hypothetical protein
VDINVFNIGGYTSRKNLQVDFYNATLNASFERSPWRQYLLVVGVLLCCELFNSEQSKPLNLCCNKFLQDCSFPMIP